MLLARVLCLCLVACALLGCGDEHARRANKKRRDNRKPRPPIIALTGEVRNELGAVPNATVFLLDKKAYGGDRSRLPHVQTDASGRFRLRTRKIEDRWIGVVHERHLHAHQDLNALDARQPIRFLLKPARRIVTTVLDEDDTPVSNQLVQLTPWPPIDLYELPDPKHRQGEHTAITDDRGRAEFWVGSEGPVTVRAELDGYFPMPHVAELSEDENVALIRAQAGVPFPRGLFLEHGRGRAPLPDGPIDVSLFCGAPDRLRLHSVHAAHCRNGRVDGAWPPGIFGLLVQAGNKQSAWVVRQEFSANQETVELGVRPEPEPGRVKLGVSASGTMVFALRLNDDWRRRGWKQLSCNEDGHWSVVLHQHVLLVARAQASRVAFQSPGDFGIPDGVQWHEGQWIRLKDEDVPLGARQLVVEHETHGRLPLIGRTTTGKKKRIRMGIELLHIRVGRPDAVVELGPYPPGTITILGIP